MLKRPFLTGSLSQSRLYGSEEIRKGSSCIREICGFSADGLRRKEATCVTFGNQLTDKIWVFAAAAEPDYKVSSEVWSLKVP
jgi:hypothetical protein